MLSTNPTNTGSSAAPGTKAYDRQFRRQALAAADAALALWIVRIPCGVFALSILLFLVTLWCDGRVGDRWSLADDLSTSVALIGVAIELGSVALRGKSAYFRSFLSGAKRSPCRSHGRRNPQQQSSGQGPAHSDAAHSLRDDANVDGLKRQKGSADEPIKEIAAHEP